MREVSSLHYRPDGKSGCLDGDRETSLLSTFGAARSDSIVDVTLDEALRVHHVWTADHRIELLGFRTGGLHLASPPDSP
jgi:hypothetical protein